MLQSHPLILADAHRLEAFALLGRPRLLDPLEIWTDGDGIPWIAAQVNSVAIGLTSLGAGWVWDEQARENPERRQELESRLQHIKNADPGQHHKELTKALCQLRLGGHAERVLWAVHRAVVADRRSLLHLPDTYLARAVWGGHRLAWPRDWHQVLVKVLRSLTWIHFAGAGDGHPSFGPNTVLLTHAGDLRGTPDDHCQADCIGYGSRHHHYQIEIGPGFLGVLEQFAQVDPQTGIRMYEFPIGTKSKKKKEEGPTLRKVGKTGRLITVYLPAKLGDSAVCEKLNDRQHVLLQAIVRETTRNTHKPRQVLTEAEILTGNMVKNFQGRKQMPCPLLIPSCQYVGFNGNGVRRGMGYRLVGPWGWLAKAGYADDEAQLFLSDMARLPTSLGLSVVGLHGKRWLSLDQLSKLSPTIADRRCLDGLHLRIYTEADYLARWNRAFGWPDTNSVTSDKNEGNQVVPAAYLADLVVAHQLSVRKLAEQLGVDHSFLSKVLRGKTCPQKLLEKAKVWEANQAQAKSFPAPTKVKTDSSKHRATVPILAVAKELLQRGWSVVPQLPGAKHPCVKWKPYQEERPTEKDVDYWWRRWPDAGLALVLGPVSDLFVIDVDGPEAHAALLKWLGSEPMAPKALSGSRQPYRYHLFFHCPDLPTKAKATPWHDKLEFRGHGGIIIIPPSQHKSGNRYAWAPGQSPDDLELPEVPAQILESLKPARRIQYSSGPAAGPRQSVTGIDASPRTLEFLSGKYENGPHWNDRLFHAACDLCGRGMPQKEAIPLLLAGAKPWNLGEEELACRTIQSAYSRSREPGRL